MHFSKRFHFFHCNWIRSLYHDVASVYSKIWEKEQTHLWSEYLGGLMLVQRLLRLDVTFFFKQFSDQYSSACCAAKCVMGQSDKFKIINVVLPQSAYRYTHAAFNV